MTDTLVLYTKNNCGYCMQAKALLNKRKVDYTEINIEEDTEARDFVINEGHRTMPQIYKQDGSLFVEGGYNGLKSYFDQQLDVADLGTL